jgi:tetratricopeptide (TPR) repeat protein
LGSAYYNPYYAAGSYASYDYSQPVTVYNYQSSDTGQPDQPPQDPANQAAMQQFDDALALFKAGSYQQALAKIDAALKVMPQDPVLHEVRALCLFALGRYRDAAATLNSLLASAPGMDWTSLSSLYGNIDDYTQQLRKLEAYVKANPKDTAAIFVLAYHYLVIGQNDAAIKMLQVVVQEQPKDETARRMLEALSPPASAAPAESTAPPAATDTSAPAGPTTDLVGRWLAKGPDATVEMVIDETWQFVWRATPTGKPPVEVKGTVSATSDMLELASKEQGSMVGRVTSGGPDKFTFQMAGSPPSDPGLTFERVK